MSSGKREHRSPKRAQSDESRSTSRADETISKVQVCLIFQDDDPDSGECLKRMLAAMCSVPTPENKDDKRRPLSIRIVNHELEKPMV